MKKLKQLLELESQLKCPSGKKGIEIAQMMHQTNFQMTLNSLQSLNLKNNNTVLEIGHGNGEHIGKLLTFANNLKYFGLEISQTMYEEAQKNNLSDFSVFKLYDGVRIPYENNLIDKIFTVNTIYFWNNPLKNFQEINRVLKSDGVFVLTFANKSFMEQLPFVANKFKLYNVSEIEQVLWSTNFEIIDKKEFEEHVKSKSGDYVKRKYSILKLQKHNV